MRIFRAGIFIAIMFMAAGCHRSGTWNDDPQNWARAFKSTKPADVVVVHSQYWHSGHFTNEYQYFFHIRSNDGIRKQLFKENRLMKIEGDEREPLFTDFFTDKPSWFIPKPPGDYDVWVYDHEEGDPPPGFDRHFRVFIDRQSRDLFLTDYQI